MKPTGAMQRKKRNERHAMSGEIREIEIPPEAWEMAHRPYHITIHHDDENGFVAEVAEFPWLVAAEETQEGAEATLRHIIALTIASAMRRGHPIPEPQQVTA
jgi:predicted RNase H-like HicB family nuclease